MEDAEEFCIEEDDNTEEEKKPRPIIKNAVDLQRLKLEKLMKNPDKPIIIPEQPREKDFMQSVPTFVRNVMGSSAGAGSGEFHVYRHLRRKEYARQKYIHAKSIREQLDDDYRQKLEQNKIDAEKKTAKKRAKRLKKKQKMKERGKRQKVEGKESDAKEKSSDSSDSDTESNEKIEDKQLLEDVQKESPDSKATSDSKPEDDASNDSSEKEEAISATAKDDETIQPETSVESETESKGNATSLIQLRHEE